MTRRLLALLALLGLALPATAALLWPVATRTTSATPAEPDTAAQRAFETARFDALRGAWPALRATPHTRRARTEQHDRDGLLRAFAEATTDGPRTLARQSGGEFDYGFFTAYISEITATPDPHDVGALALSNLSDVLRHTGAYVFARRDSVLTDQTLEIVEATARPGAGDGRNVRRFTLLVEPETRTVVGVDVRRIDLGTWFREESRARVETQRLPDGRAVPARTDFESLVVMPFRPAQPISTMAIYTPTGG